MCVFPVVQCAVACMDQNDTDPEVQLPFRHVQVIEKVKERETVFTNVSIACMHCSDAPCVQACPAGCLYKDEATGLTLYDNNKCIGCHSCVMACPFGAPVFYGNRANGKVRRMCRQARAWHGACVCQSMSV